MQTILYSVFRKDIKKDIIHNLSNKYQIHASDMEIRILDLLNPRLLIEIKNNHAVSVRFTDPLDEFSFHDLVAKYRREAV